MNANTETKHTPTPQYRISTLRGGFVIKRNDGKGWRQYRWYSTESEALANLAAIRNAK